MALEREEELLISSEQAVETGPAAVFIGSASCVFGWHTYSDAIPAHYERMHTLGLK